MDQTKKITKKEKKKTISGTSKPIEVIPPQNDALNKAIGQYGPLLEGLGIDINFFLKLPQIMDAVVSKIDNIERRLDEVTASKKIIGRINTEDVSTSSVQGFNIGELLKNPDASNLIKSIIDMFKGGGEDMANKEVNELAKTILEESKRLAMDSIKAAFQRAGDAEYLRKLGEGAADKGG